MAGIRSGYERIADWTLSELGYDGIEDVDDDDEDDGQLDDREDAELAI